MPTDPFPPKCCLTCSCRKTCETLCPELDKWLDDTYRDHDSVEMITMGVPIVEWRI